MVDDGREHGNDRRATDEANSRHYEQRRPPAIWHLANGSLAKFAAAVAGAVFLVGLVMQVLGFRFTGSGADIKQLQADRDDIKSALTAHNLALATLTTGAATTLAASATQARDISDIKSTLSSLRFINCALYAKVYAGAPTLSECLQTADRAP